MAFITDIVDFVAVTLIDKGLYGVKAQLFDTFFTPKYINSNPVLKHMHGFTHTECAFQLIDFIVYTAMR